MHVLEPGIIHAHYTGEAHVHSYEDPHAAAKELDGGTILLITLLAFVTAAFLVLRWFWRAV